MIPENAIAPTIEFIESGSKSRSPKMRRVPPPPPKQSVHPKGKTNRPPAAATPPPDVRRLGPQFAPKPTSGPAHPPLLWAYYDGDVEPVTILPDSSPANRAPRFGGKSANSKRPGSKKGSAPSPEEVFKKQYGITSDQLSQGKQMMAKMTAALSEMESEQAALEHAVDQLCSIVDRIPL